MVIEACDKSFTDNGILRWYTGGSTGAGGTTIAYYTGFYIVVRKPGQVNDSF